MVWFGLVHLGGEGVEGADGCGGERERERQKGGVFCEVSAGLGGFGVAGSGDLGEGCGSFVV